MGLSSALASAMSGLRANQAALSIVSSNVANSQTPGYVVQTPNQIEVTDGSGPALYGASGKIVGSALEGSNTDIADEFTKLIVTQQAYSANTKVITTANSMVQDLLNVLR